MTLFELPAKTGIGIGPRSEPARPVAAGLVIGDSGDGDRSPHSKFSHWASHISAVAASRAAESESSRDQVGVGQNRPFWLESVESF